MGKVDLKVALNPDVPFYLLILAPREWVFYLPAFLSFFMIWKTVILIYSRSF